MVVSPTDRFPLFVDTGAWFAYLVRGHPEGDAIETIIGSDDALLVTSSYILDELVTLIQSRATHAHAVKAGAALRDPANVQLMRVTGADEDAAWHLFKARPDKGYSLTDCTSFVVMERMGIDHALATDGDFAREGFIDVLAATGG